MKTSTRIRSRSCGLATCAVGAALLAACSSSQKVPSIYVHPNADLYAFERVAILPIENLTPDRFAGEKVREVLALELSAMGAFEVIESGEVNRVLRVVNVQDLTTIGPEIIAQLGSELGVQGILVGSVMEYREQRSGNLITPDVAIALHLIDVETGVAVWSVGDARKKIGVWTRLFGVGQQTQTEALRTLIRELMVDLYAFA